LHWRYYGFTIGIDASEKSFEKVNQEKPEWLAPSHGDLIQNPEEAVASNRRIYEQLRPMLIPNELHKPSNDIREILPHLYFLGGNSYVILSESGKAFMYDIGWDWPGDVSMKRLEKFKEKMGISEISVVTFSHHHGDHKNRLPDLFRLDDPEVWVFENMVDIFENPSRYKLPGRPLGIYADRILRDKEKVQWEEYTLEFTSFPSQLQYHQALFTVIDGKRVLFTGDGSWKPIDPNRSMNGPVIPHQDYFLDGGYIICTRKMLEYLPEIICPSHTEEYYPTKEQLEGFQQWSLELRKVMTELIDQPDPNFGMDARWCHFYPYRLVVDGEKAVEFELRIRNYLYIPAEVEVELRLPAGFECSHPQRNVTIPAKKEVAIPFQLLSSTIEKPGRTIITADITVNDSHIGEYAEAIVESRLPILRY
jgi:glyoxylase-like metal-dependent hydrolase (beta-lactamase superfamily II)